MLVNTKAVIEAAIGGDATITKEQKDKIKSILTPKASCSAKRSLITTKQAASILDVSTVTLRKYAKKGLLKPIRYTARRIRWDRDEIELFKSQGVEATPA